MAGSVTIAKIDLPSHDNTAIRSLGRDVVPTLQSAAAVHSAAMKIVAHTDLLEASLLSAYRAARAYTDAFTVDVPGAVMLVLSTLVAKPSRDAEAQSLADGQGTRFAAWTVEAREADEIVMCDFLKKTRSWLRVEPQPTGTRLWFGSAVVPEHILPDGRVRLGAGFDQLIPVHRFYSRALLSAAARRLVTAY